MSQMFKKIGRKKKEDAFKEDPRPLPTETEGFICPICMEALRSADALQIHWEAAHSAKETEPAKVSTKSSGKLEAEIFVVPQRQEGMDELEHCKLQMKIMTDLINEERRQNTNLCGELSMLEGVLEQSGDQAQEELRALKQMFEQSEQSRTTLTFELQRLTNENSRLEQDRQTLTKTNERISEKAASLAVTVATLQAKLDETSARADEFHSQVIKLQTGLKEQEVRNERLSVKLQQRPEADDVHALQQQLSCLHILMEKNSSEHELEMEKMRSEMKLVEGDKERLERECLQLKKSLEERPRVDTVSKLDYQLANLEKESEGKQESIEKAAVKLGELQSKLDAAPKRELLDKYVSDVERLTGELKEAKDVLNVKEELTRSLQTELRAAPKQSFIERLETELKDLKSQHHVKVEEIRNRDAQVRELELALAAAPKQEKLQRLEAELKAMQNQLNLAPKPELVESLEASTSALETALHQVKEQLQQKVVACLVLQEQHSQVQMEVSRREEELANSKTEVETAQKEKHDKELLLAAVRQELKQNHAQLTQLQAKLEASEEREAGLEVGVGESKEKIALLQQERTELISKMEAGEGVVTAINQLQQEKKALQGKLDEVVSMHHEKMREWEEKMDSLSGRLSQLQDEVDSQHEQCQSLVSELERRQAACSSTQGKVEQLTSEVQAKESLLLYKEREHSESVAEVHDRMETATRELEQCTRKMASLKENHDQFKLRASTEGRELEEQLESVREEAQKQLQEMAAHLHSKESLLSEREKEFAKLKSSSEGEVQELNQRLTHTQTESEDSQKFLRSQLDVQARNTEEQVTALQLQLTSIQSKKAESETKLTSQIMNFEDVLQGMTRAVEDQGRKNETTLQQLDIKLASEVKLHEELDSFTKKLEQQDNNLKVETSRSEEMVLEIAGLKVQLKEKGDQLTVFEKTSEHKLEMLQALKTDIERGQRDYDETCSQHEVELTKKTEELEEEMSKVDALDRELDGARDDFKDLNAQLDQAEIDLADAMKRASEAEEALGKSKQDFLRVKGRLGEEVVQLDRRLSEEEKKRKSLTVEMVALETALNKSRKSLSTTTEENEQLKGDLTVIKKRHGSEQAKWQQEKLALSKEKERLGVELGFHQDLLSTLKQEMAQVRKKFEADIQKSQMETKEEVAAIRMDLVARDDELKCIHEHRNRSDMQHQVEITALSSNLAALRQQVEGGKRKVEFHDIKVKGLTEQLEDMKGKSRSQQDEHRTLLEKFLALEDQNKSLLEHKAMDERRNQELQMGLQELGREHQTLQIVKSRQHERKWEKDKEAVACSLCHVPFSVSMRRHHCRNCGIIFCQSCTSMSAQIPSSKKPVRVCNTCFTDLTGH